MAYKTKADCSFEEKLGDAMRRRDWATVETIFGLYGSYLELLTPLPPVPSKELAKLPTDPTPLEDLIYELTHDADKASGWLY